MTFAPIVKQMWDLYTDCYRDKPSPRTISHGIVNAPFAIAPRVRCLCCGNKVVPARFSVEAFYCPCCNTQLAFPGLIDDIVIPQEIDCEVRLKQLGLIL